MKRNTKIAIGSAVVILAAIGACTPDKTAARDTPGTPTAYTAAPAAAPTKNPYATDGTYLVGTEIMAGDYRATQRGSLMGYVEVCADAACKIGTDGFISNDLVDGSSVVNIPANAKYVKLQRVTLAAL